ncbi:hypothetical protein ES708_18038 [subsurface metagenome]
MSRNPNMKNDLLTIFPGIVLETQTWNHGKKVNDPNACDDIVFNNTRIISYKKLRFDSSILGKKYIPYIEEIHNKIIDSAGSPLDDYTIILDKNIDGNLITHPTSDSQQLITYFSYLQHLDIWISIDFIKTLCFPGGGRLVYLNNQHEHWTPKYSYLLPIEQNHKRKLKIHKDDEKLLINLFARTSIKDRDKYKRLINAISLFNESCRINRINPNSSIVLIVSALESLLNIPRWHKKESFAYALKIFWGFEKGIGKWAEELYELRSQIVHGEDITGEKLLVPKDRHCSYFSIARGMFHHCLMFILESFGNVKIERRYKFKVIREITNKIISNKKKASNILRQKSKFTYQSFVNKHGLYKEFILRIEELTPTDDSAKSDIIKLLDLVFSIAETWIKDEKVKYNRSPTKGYIDFRNQKFDNILTLFASIRQIKWSVYGNFKLHDKIGELEEEVRQLEPVVRDKDKFKFTIAEFLNRCLWAISLVY